jgi:hypothetical protein
MCLLLFFSLSEHTNGEQLTWEMLQQSLTQEGEAITQEDLDAYLAALTGGGTNNIPPYQAFDAKTFAENVLGFEDFASNS